jgi:hypothetical protein
MRGSTAFAMAEGTTSIESAGRAKKATAAKSEALEPRAYSEAGSRCKRPLHGRAWATLSNQLESAPELSQSLQALYTTAQNTILILEAKVNTLESLVYIPQA